MGIFSKKLDYSSGNGVLPRLGEGEYTPLRLPSTSVVHVPNLSLMMKEKEQGNLDKAYIASAEASGATENDAEIRSVIKKYLAPLRRRVAPSLTDDATQMLGRCMTWGCGMAIVEWESGLMLAGKSHPSIWNGIYRVTLYLGEEQEVRLHFQDIPFYKHLLSIAVEVGYVGMRMNSTVSVEEMLASVRAN